jgi:hypothetical protein
LQEFSFSSSSRLLQHLELFASKVIPAFNREGTL